MMIPPTIPFLTLFSLLTISSTAAKDHYLINCGLPKSTTATSSSNDDHRIWRSDDDPTFSPPNLNTISSSATAVNGGSPPYSTARVFNSSFTYSFPISSPGPILLRLYFYYDTTTISSPSQSPVSLSLQANGFTLFHDYIPKIGVQSLHEFQLIVFEHTKTLNLTFSPGSSNNYGIINGIEIVSTPDNLYINQTKVYTNVNSPDNGFSFQNTNLTAFETAFRLNVGGWDVSPADDSGGLGRAWINDRDYLAGGFVGAEGGLKYGTPAEVNYTATTPEYVAPASVYGTERIMGRNSPEINLGKNLTWRFEVDVGFDYLVRLHFCEMNLDVKGSGFRVFNGYINNETAFEGLDVWAESGGLGVPIYRDFVVNVYGGGGGGDGGGGSNNGSKATLSLTLHPLPGFRIADVLLNGLEIFKLSQPDGNLAVPNPPSPTEEPPTSPPSPGGNGTNHHHFLPIIGGILGGVILISLIITFACLLLVRKKRANLLLTRMSTDTTKTKWGPLSINSGSTTSTGVASSLPSDLCRRFSLAQIRVATCDFDEDTIIGSGGFGNVYRGTIDGGGGPTMVAIKRLIATSKQGAHEFRTEIEMLSRLRHLHLVSLIGYCEDQGEMILVYEYMPRGTLRDHLLYKNNHDNYDNSITQLTWKQRLMICLGAARGLHYLHSGAKELIIHRDVKSTNILLDDKWTAKVSDFGLSKVGPASETGLNHVSTAVKGSVGYLDPEYYKRQQLTEKSDVYSFGVVLFEVLCARPAMDPRLPKEQVNLAMWARSRYRSGSLQTIVDENLTGQIAPECLRKFGEIAELCVREHGSERPMMGDVVWGLEFALKLQETAENNIENNGFNGGDNEGNNTSDASLNEIICGNEDAMNIVNFDDEEVVFSGTEENLSMSSGTANTSDNRLAEMKSGSVFSEILRSEGR